MGILSIKLLHFLFRSVYLCLQLPGGDPEDTGAQGGELDEAVGAGHADPVIAAQVPGKGLDIGVRRLTLPGEDYLDGCIPVLLAAGLPVAVEYQNDPGLCKACVAGQSIRQVPPGGGQVRFGRFCQAEYDRRGSGTVCLAMEQKVLSGHYIRFDASFCSIV